MLRRENFYFKIFCKLNFISICFSFSALSPKIVGNSEKGEQVTNKVTVALSKQNSLDHKPTEENLFPYVFYSRSRIEQSIFVCCAEKLAKITFLR